VKTFAACALLLSLILPAAWSGAEAEQPTTPVTAGAYRVTDCLGRTLRFQKVPERIVLAGRGALLIVDAVYLFPDARSRVVGVGSTNQGLGDFFPILDPRSAEKARFDNSAGPEQLAGLKPDLVLLKSYMKERLGDSLESIGIPVLYVDLESPAAFSADIRMLGDLFQDPARAAFVTRYYDARVAAIPKRVEGARRPSALVVQYSERDGGTSFSIPPLSWIQTLMVETAGGEPVWKAAGVGTGWNKVSAEQAAAWEPEHVLVVSYLKPSTDVVGTLRKSGSWAGKLSPFPADYHSWDQSDSRWILGLQWVAKVLHPDLFAGLDLRTETASFYGELYGIDRQTIETKILPRLEGAFAAE
jgi:iron complex transport system substrate-binding protein